jgi:hypothetical protein
VKKTKGFENFFQQPTSTRVNMINTAIFITIDFDNGNTISGWLYTAPSDEIPTKEDLDEVCEMCLSNFSDGHLKSITLTDMPSTRSTLKCVRITNDVIAIQVSQRTYQPGKAPVVDILTMRQT